ncbi:MAG: glycosyltransferase family 39 protein [Methanosphaera sp.]|nr:glycosyltransferase family 39 protein [Methanosphaera sp.]
MKHINIDTKSRRLLVLLAIIMIIYTSILLYSQTIRSISYWDIFVYLQNAMLFSSHNIGSQLSLPPVLSLLVAIPFRLGFISEFSMFLVVAILFILLVIGVYVLFNYKFEPEVSFVSSIIFSMLSLVVYWALSGSTDLPALTFSVWALVFTIKGLNDDFKYYYVAFSMFLLAFFTRFTNGFILLVMLAYLVVNFKQFYKQCTRSSVLKLLLFMVVTVGLICSAYLINQGTIPFISQFFEVSSSSQVSSVNVGYDLNPLFYIENLPELLVSNNMHEATGLTQTMTSNSPSFLSYVILVLSAIGILSFIYDILRKYDGKIRGKYYVIYLASMFVITFFTIITYTNISYIITELLFILLLFLALIYHKGKFDGMDLVMFLWIGIFIIMHSYHPVKVDRYILTIFIPLIYYMIKGCQYIVDKLELKTRNKKSLLIMLVIILLILIPVNASFISTITQENPHTNEEKQAAQWLEEYDQNYANKTISSDRGVAFSWYLEKYTYSTIPRVVEANNQTLEEYLSESNATYYIDSTSKLDGINGYHVIYDNNNTNNPLKIYEKG